MKKFKVISYYKKNAFMPTNGGTLIITDNEYIIKYLFLTVARYDVNKTVASKISFISKGINLNDGKKKLTFTFSLRQHKKYMSY